MRSCVNAGVDLTMHLIELYRDDALLQTVIPERAAEEGENHADP